MNSESDWQEISHDGNAAAMSARKIPLAEYRYGKEEMISLHPDVVLFPTDICDVPTIVRQTILQPLAFVPLTEEEQVVLTGNVNSGFAYSSRGRGGYYRGGSRGRGRGGRTDYHRSSSGGDELSDRGGYYRSSSDSTWNDEGKSAYHQTKGGRASRDSNWRSNQPPIVSSDNEEKSTKSTSNVGDKKDHWNPLPEWATDDMGKSVGAFDGQGRFSTSDMDNVDEQSPCDSSDESDREDTFRGKKIDIDSFEDVFEKEGDIKSNDTDQQIPPVNGPLEGERKEDNIQPNENITQPFPPPSKAKENRMESVDSVEEMQRRFEKTAEAVLSTEDEDTPSPSPNFIITPNQSTHLPPVSSDSAPVTCVEGTQQWLYKDPRGDLQGPFKNHEMSEWFAAGYFTMELTVKRVCDAMFLPLGQIIRIWGRVPFSSGPQPPPLQQSEPFWQQMFKKQQELFPESNPPPPAPPHSSNDHQPTPSSTVVPPPTSTSDPSPIWGSISTRISPEEEQWPDLSVVEQPQTTAVLPDQVEHINENIKNELKLAQEEEERKKAEMKLEEEIARKIEEDRKREKEQKLKIEADIKKRKEEEKKQKAIEQERLKQQKIDEEKKKRKLENEKAELIRKQKEESKQSHSKKNEEKERYRKEEQNHDSNYVQPLLPQPHPPPQTLPPQYPQYQPHLLPQQQFTPESDEGLKGWLYDYNNPQSSAPSLLQIQQEEKKREKVLTEERRLILQQQQQQILEQQQQSGGPSWSSPTSAHGNKQLSFLEIQEEQERLFGVRARDDVHVVPSAGKNNSKKVNAPPTQSSWSKIAASNKPSFQPTTTNWGPSSQPILPSPSSTVPSSTVPHSHKDNSLSFWDECARETTTNSDTTSSNYSTGKIKSGGEKNDKNTSNRGTSKKREEEKVRELFSCKGGDDPFTVWCAEELVKFNTDVDAATFVSLLLEVESTYEVHDYIKSFLGETDEVHSFAKQFLERRQKLGNYSHHHQQQQKKSSSSDSASVNASSSTSSSRSSKKKKKGKMQKMPPSALLGFTVNAAERPNAGEIHSIKDAL